MNINDLPVELLIQIFVNLDIFHWTEILPDVCTSWKSISTSYTPYISKIIAVVKCTDIVGIEKPINYDNQHRYEIVVSMKNIYKLKHVTKWKLVGPLNDYDYLIDVIKIIKGRINDIKEIIIYSFFGAVTVDFLEEFALLCPNLTSLAIILSSSHFYKIPFDKISNFKKLKVFKTDDYSITDVHMISLSNNELQEFDIPLSLSISDQAMTIFLHKQKTHLQKLVISGYRLTSISFIAISQCHNLTILAVFDARHFQVEDVPYIIKLPKLHSILLQRLTLNKNVLEKFLEDLDNKKTVKFVDFKFSDAILVLKNKSFRNIKIILLEKCRKNFSIQFGLKQHHAKRVGTASDIYCRKKIAAKIQYL
uniref:F-box domain-containing protein n=1 Tax=Clastoptera arizonana TaxID=38151 RepID=A0A1B6DKE6_9HEMI